MEHRRQAQQRGRNGDDPVPPFWTRIPAIARYPLRGGALFSLLALTLFSLLGKLPGIGSIFAIVTLMASYAYGFEILRHSADGYVDPPEYPQHLFDGSLLRLFALVTLAIVLTLTVYLLSHNLTATVAVALVITLLAPASVISLAIDQSLRRAINPVMLLAVTSRIGWPYLAACGLLLVIEISAVNASHWLQGHLPPLIDHLTVYLVSCWGLFATCHLLGYLVYQYHQALGFAPATLADDGYRDPDQQLLDDAENQIREGQLDQARQQLREAVRSRAVNLQVHALYHRLLQQSPATEALAEHARLYLPRLLDEGQPRRALGLMRSLLDRQPDFVPADINHAATLAEQARLAGQHRLACDILLALLENSPRSPQAGQWSLDAARLLGEHLGREDQARRLLRQALTDNPDPELQRRAQAALAALPANQVIEP